MVIFGLLWLLDMSEESLPSVREEVLKVSDELLVELATSEVYATPMTLIEKV
jgi:hypothetical protein